MSLFWSWNLSCGPHFAIWTSAHTHAHTHTGWLCLCHTDVEHPVFWQEECWQESLACPNQSPHTHPSLVPSHTHACALLRKEHQFQRNIIRRWITLQEVTLLPHWPPIFCFHFFLPSTRLFTVPLLLLVCPSASREASQSDLLVQKHQRSDLQLGPRRERGDAHQHAVRPQVQTQVPPHCYNNILTNMRHPFKKIL